MRVKWTYIVLGALLGLGLSFFLAWVSFIYAIHDGFRVASYLFPYTVLMSPDMTKLSVTSLLAALILWPLYGAILGGTIKSGARKWQLIAACLVIQHVAVASLARMRVESLQVLVTLEPHERRPLFVNYNVQGREGSGRVIFKGTISLTSFENNELNGTCKVVKVENTFAGTVDKDGPCIAEIAGEKITFYLAPQLSDGGVVLEGHWDEHRITGTWRIESIAGGITVGTFEAVKQ